MPLAGSLKPEKSGGWERYWLLTVTDGLAALAPAMKPASNFLMRSVATPPTKPTWLVFDLRAAAAPTRKEPCSSAKVSWATLGPAESADASSMMANLTSGLALATAPMALA